MRRLLAMLALAVGALVFVPATSASADTFAGACTISGTATFPSPVTADAGGAGTLSCGGAVSTGGSATVAFVSGPRFDFTIDLQGAGSEVNFVIHDDGGGAGVGHATFAEEITRAPECAAGITSLGFDVVAGAVKLVE